MGKMIQRRKQRRDHFECVLLISGSELDELSHRVLMAVLDRMLKLGAKHRCKNGPLLHISISFRQHRRGVYALVMMARYRNDRHR